MRRDNARDWGIAKTYDGLGIPRTRSRGHQLTCTHLSMVLSPSVGARWVGAPRGGSVMNVSPQIDSNAF
eukprot:820544-Prymnesium_polylepis.1